MKPTRFAALAAVGLLLLAGIGALARAGQAPKPQPKVYSDIKVVDVTVDKNDGCRLWVWYQNVGNKRIQATLREVVRVQGATVDDTMMAFDLQPGGNFGHAVGADPGYHLTGTNKSVTAQVDADNVLPELNEANNTLTKTLGCVLVSASAVHGALAAQPQGLKPDLVIPFIKFQVVQEYNDSSGHPRVLFNAIVYVKNAGTAGCGPFDVLLEHNLNGTSGWSACQTCKIHVPGLAAGQGLELAPRQYNKGGTTTGGEAMFYRATADCDNAREESNETNNVYKTSYPAQSLHR